MASNGTHPRRGIAAVLLALAGLTMVLAATVALPPPAAAQLFGREPPRQRPSGGDFFNPFRMLFPPFQRGGPQYREAPPRPAAPSADYSRAPAPHKAELPPEKSIVVMGDSMADWLAYGLEQAFADQPEIGVVRKFHTYSGLLRYDSHNDQDWAQVARDMLKTEKADIVVMMLGLHDRLTIREKLAPAQPAGEEKKGAREPKRGATAAYEFRSDKWVEAYDKRIDATIAALKSKGVPVLWVGLPALRGARSTSDMVFLNDQFRARAEKAGIIYVDVWDGFVDEGGKFTLHGPDVEGQLRTLRTGDGVHFTKWGARKLAHYVEREIKRVLGTHLAPMATITPDEANANPGQPAATLRPGIPATRPLAGPVVPLSASSGNAHDLLGGGNAKPNVGDPIAVRVLVKGDAVAPPRGRADDFARATPNAAAPTAAPSAAANAAPHTAAPNAVASTVPTLPAPAPTTSAPIIAAAPPAVAPTAAAPAAAAPTAAAPTAEAPASAAPKPADSNPTASNAPASAPVIVAPEPTAAAPAATKTESARLAKPEAPEKVERVQKPKRVVERKFRPAPPRESRTVARRPFRPQPFDPFGILR